VPDRFPTARAWCFDIDRTLRHVIPVTWVGGCRQLRPVGRLALFENFRQHPGAPLLPEGEVVGRGDGPDPTWVFVVGSTAGGTGGAVFLDVCRLAKIRHRGAPVAGILAVADAFTGTYQQNAEAMTRARANTGAALLEIERNLDPFVQDGGVQYVYPSSIPNWRPGDEIGATGALAYPESLDPPLGFCFLVDGLREDWQGRAQETTPGIEYDVSRSMAEFVALLSHVDSGPRLRAAVNSSAATPRRFSRYTMGTIAYPIEDLRRYRGLATALHVIQGHLLGAGPGGPGGAADLPSDLAEERRPEGREEWGNKHLFLSMLGDPRFVWNGGSEVLTDDGMSVDLPVLQHNRSKQLRSPTRFREQFRLGGQVAAPTTGDLVRSQLQRGERSYVASCDLLQSECEQHRRRFLGQASEQLQQSAQAVAREGSSVLRRRIAEHLNDPGHLAAPSADTPAHVRVHTPRSEKAAGLAAALSTVNAVQLRLDGMRDQLHRPEIFRGPGGRERDPKPFADKIDSAWRRMRGAWPDWLVVLLLVGVGTALWSLAAAVLGIGWFDLAGLVEPLTPDVAATLSDLAGEAQDIATPLLWFLLLLYALSAFLLYWFVWSRPAHQRRYIQANQDLLRFQVETEVFQALCTIADELQPVVAAERRALERAFTRLQETYKQLQDRLGAQGQMLRSRPGLQLLGASGENLDTLPSEDTELADAAARGLKWVEFQPPGSHLYWSLDLQPVGSPSSLGLSLEPFDAETVAEGLQELLYSAQKPPTQSSAVGALLQARGTRSHDYFTKDFPQRSSWMLSVSRGASAAHGYLVISENDPLFPQSGNNVVSWRDATRVAWVGFEHGISVADWRQWGVTCGEYRQWRKNPALAGVHTTLQNTVAALLEDFTASQVAERPGPFPHEVTSALSHFDVLDGFAHAWATKRIDVGQCRDGNGPFQGLVLLAASARPCTQPDQPSTPGGTVISQDVPLSTDRRDVIGSALRLVARQPLRRPIVCWCDDCRSRNLPDWLNEMESASPFPNTLYPDGFLQDWNDLLHRAILRALREQGRVIPKVRNF